MLNDSLKKTLYFKNKYKWRIWLEKNHDKLNEIWLIHYKKSLNKQGLNHQDAVEEAICYGWIDSKLKKIDEERFILRYSPRKLKSVWSKINKETAEKMIQKGKMTKAGLEKINLELLELYERAKYNPRYLKEKQNYIRNLEALKENYRHL